MEFINKILKSDASYASKNMVAGMSDTTSTTKLLMKANISKVRGIRELSIYRRNDKSPLPQHSDCTKVGAVDNSLSLLMNNSKYKYKLTPFEKPLVENAIKSGKTMKEALGFARKTLFMKMRERISEKGTRNSVSGDFKQPWSEVQTSGIVNGTVHLSLVPFDVKHAPLSFTQMEQIYATIIDMVIEHNRREINAESLNCQFKTGWMAFKCSTTTAEWLRFNCNDISQKCQVMLNVVEEINQDEKNVKQNQITSTQTRRLKRQYYLALHNLRKLKKAKENGVPLKNAQLLRNKYESMIEDYLETEKNGRRLRKFLILDGILDRPKKAKTLHKQYRMALHRLDKLKKIEHSGTPLDENKLITRLRLQAVVDKFLKEQKDDKKPIGKSFRPFHEVITDPLCVAVGGKRKGLFVPIPKDWPAIELQINERVDSYDLENQDESPVPRYDMTEIHRGFRVIKCMDEFSKKFLFKCITSIKDKWEELNLMIIPASQIPKGRRDPIDLEVEAAIKKIKQTTDVGSSKSVKTIPSTSVSTSAENMDFQTSLKKIGFHQNQGRVQPENQHSKISNPFRSLESGTPQYHNFTPHTPENFTENRDFGEDFSPTSCRTKNYLNSAVESEFNDRFQASNETLRRSSERNYAQSHHVLMNSRDRRRSPEFYANSGSNRTKFYRDYFPDRSNPYSIDRLPPENFTENRSFREEFSPASCRTKNYWSSAVESEFSDRFPASNKTLRRSSERNDAQTLETRDRWRSPDFYANSDSNRTKFYQDSFPDCSNSYSIDRLPAASRRSSERNPVQTHTLNNFDDWRRSPDFYESSMSNARKVYQESDAFRNPRWLEPNEISMRSREKILVERKTLGYSERRWRSSGNRSLYRSIRDRSPNTISTRNRKRSPALMNSEKRRKSPDFHAKLTQYDEDFPPHYGNPYRNSSSPDSFKNRYHKLGSFDILCTEEANHNVRGKGSNRSNEFYDVSGHRDFESFPNYFSRTNSLNNNSYSRREKNYLPSDDDDIPPPPSRWN